MNAKRKVNVRLNIEDDEGICLSASTHFDCVPGSNKAARQVRDAVFSLAIEAGAILSEDEPRLGDDPSMVIERLVVRIPILLTKELFAIGSKIHEELRKRNGMSDGG